MPITSTVAASPSSTGTTTPDGSLALLGQLFLNLSFHHPTLVSSTHFEFILEILVFFYLSYSRWRRIGRCDAIQGCVEKGQVVQGTPSQPPIHTFITSQVHLCSTSRLPLKNQWTMCARLVYDHHISQPVSTPPVVSPILWPPRHCSLFLEPSQNIATW